MGLFTPKYPAGAAPAKPAKADRKADRRERQRLCAVEESIYAERMRLSREYDRLNPGPDDWTSHRGY